MDRETAAALAFAEMTLPNADATVISVDQIPANILAICRATGCNPAEYQTMAILRDELELCVVEIVDDYFKNPAAVEIAEFCTSPYAEEIRREFRAALAPKKKGGRSRP